MGVEKFPGSAYIVTNIGTYLCKKRGEVRIDIFTLKKKKKLIKKLVTNREWKELGWEQDFFEYIFLYGFT